MDRLTHRNKEQTGFLFTFVMVGTKHQNVCEILSLQQDLWFFSQQDLNCEQIKNDCLYSSDKKF